jgi:hypothetical protein
LAKGPPSERETLQITGVFIRLNAFGSILKPEKQSIADVFLGDFANYMSGLTGERKREVFLFV